jgi:hypothetical protein
MDNKCLIDAMVWARNDFLMTSWCGCDGCETLRNAVSSAELENLPELLDDHCTEYLGALEDFNGQ